MDKETIKTILSLDMERTEEVEKVEKMKHIIGKYLPNNFSNKACVFGFLDEIRKEIFADILNAEEFEAFYGKVFEDIDKAWGDLIVQKYAVIEGIEKKMEAL